MNAVREDDKASFAISYSVAQERSSVSLANESATSLKMNLLTGFVHTSHMQYTRRQPGRHAVGGSGGVIDV